MSHRSKSKKNFLFSLLGTLTTIALGLVLPRLWIVSYGSEVSGLLNSLSDFLVYLGLFEAGVGTATMQALYKPIAQDNWEDINGVLSATNSYLKKTGRWYFGGLMVLCFLYPLIVDSSLSYATIFGAVFFSGIGNVVTFYIQGKYTYLLQTDGKLYITHTLTSLVYIANSLVKILLIYLGCNIVFILATGFVIHCLQAVYILWYVKKHYPNIRLDTPPNNAALQQKNSVLLHQISGLIFSHTDVLLLTVFCDLRVVSVYALFKTVPTSLVKLINIPFSSIQFSLGQIYQTDKPRYTRQIDLVDAYHSALVCGVFAATYYLFIPFIRLYTAGVTDANYVDPWLALLFVVCSVLDRIRRPMQTTISFAGHYRQTLSHTIAESAINLAASLIGVWLLGVYGVLLGTVIALAYRTVAGTVYANRKLLERSPGKTFLIYLTNIGCILLLQVLMGLVFGGIEMNSYLTFALVGAGCSCLCLLVTIGIQTLILPDCRRFAGSMLSRITRRLSRKA